MRTGRLFRKYAFVLLALVVGALVVGGAQQLYFSYDDEQRAIASFQREKAAAAAQRIQQFVREADAQIDGLSSQRFTVIPSLAILRTDFLRVVATAPAINGLEYIDADGLQQILIRRGGTDVFRSLDDASNEPRFAGARQKYLSGGLLQQSWYGPVQFRDGSEPYMIIARPDRTDPGGVTAVELNLRLIYDLVTQIRFGETGIAYVVDRHGTLIAHPDVGLVLRRSELGDLRQVRAALAGDLAPYESAFTAPNVSGTQVVTAWQTIGALGWTVFVEESVDEAYAPLYQALARTLVLVLAGTLVAVGAAVFFARQLVGPVEVLRASASRVGEGMLEERIVLHTGDELEDLAREFNEMTARLRESYATLEQKVEERTTQLAETSRQLEVASRHKSEFLANMSHELRTPLNAVIGYSEMLQEEVADLGQPALVPDLRKINTAGRYLLDLINNILDLSKIEAGKMELFLETFEVAPLVEDVSAVIQPLIAKKGNALNVQCAPDIGGMRADKTKLRQVLFNLLSNAAKFTERGRVTLQVERIGADIHFVVADSGIGMTPEQLGKLFQAFSQASAETSKNYGGTGLGLALAQRFCQLMGGEITVTSAPGKGSRFAARIPANVAEPVAAAADPVAAGAGGAS